MVKSPYFCGRLDQLQDQRNRDWAHHAAIAQQPDFEVGQPGPPRTNFRTFVPGFALLPTIRHVPQCPPLSVTITCGTPAGIACTMPFT
jgi:hypothetical protein